MANKLKPLLPNEEGNISTLPGDNNKFLAHALAINSLPPIDNTNPAHVERRVTEYFTLCAQNDVRPTVTGFRSALGVSRTSLWEWKTGHSRAGTHQEIILRGYDMLEELWEQYMLNGKINPVAGIFLGKNNFGYQDKQEYVLTPKTTMEQVDPIALEAKYAELPELPEED